MHRYASPTRFVKIARLLTPWFLSIGALALIAGAWAGLTQVPQDYLQGQTVRILYVHVPAAWLGMGGWGLLTLAALSQLVWRHPLAGIAARAVAVPGMMFTGLCLATGAIWGKPTWGTWWEWDGRMTSMLILFFLYVGFVALVGMNGGCSREAQPMQNNGFLPRAGAIYALIGAVNLPIINRSVVWWNSLHQGPSITLRGSTIDSALLWPLGLTLAGFSLLFGAIVMMRMRAIIAENRLTARRRRMLESDSVGGTGCKSDSVGGTGCKRDSAGGPGGKGVIL